VPPFLADEFDLLLGALQPFEPVPDIGTLVAYVKEK